MKLERRLRAPELLSTRLDVLRAGLRRLKQGDQEGAETVRRMGRVLIGWAGAEGLKEVEEVSSAVFRAEPKMLLEAGLALKTLLEEIVEELGPADSERFVVLAVEENPDDALLLEVALAAKGRALHVVPTVAAAEAVLKKEEVALLVLDLRLPDGDGRTLLVRAREEERYRDLTILVVSGVENPETRSECLALGATEFFSKPVDPLAVGSAASSALHQEAKRRFNARSDPLTHLLSRRSVRELWDRWTFPTPSSIGLVGIDAFQALEERFAHEVADSVVASVGHLIRDLTTRGCVAARWEESRFLVLGPGLPAAVAADLLWSILTGVRGLEHGDPDGETFRVTASAGVAEISAGSTFDDAVAEAGARLDEAMESGGNTLADTPGASDAVSVLVAEDDPLSAAILIHRLEKEGFSVLHYPDGALALEGALSHRVSMAILDVKMPGMDGFELLERLRKVPSYYSLPIMMLTSMGREEDIERGFALGADDYMVKPFSPVEVLARVRRLLNR